MELRRHLDVALSVAKKAGEYLLAQEHSSSLTITQKHENDYVTNVDGSCERLIISLLHEHFPDEHVFGEEGGSDGMGNSGRWIIDPIDGTTNFFRGIPNYTISIAWEMESHNPLIGVVYNPRQGELFYAAKGLGAWCDDKPLKVSTIADPSKALLVCVPPHRHHEATKDYFSVMQKLFMDVSDLRSFGSAALELSYIAAGRLDGYYEKFLGYYDIAGGMAVLQEAGGMISSSDLDMPLSDSRCDIVASNGLLHPWLEKMVRPN